MKLDEARRRFGVTGREASGAPATEESEATRAYEEYDAAYAEADLAGRLGEVIYRQRAAAGLTETALAARMGTSADEIARAEEGDPDLALSVDYLDRLGRALGLTVTVTVATEEVRLGAPPAADA